jgi:3-oxoacyl-[acyl-carrier protein] reductase
MASAANKTAVITGGSRGIGRAVSERLAAEGYNIAIAFRSDEASALEVADAVRQAGGSAVCVRCDVACSDDVSNLFDTAHKAFGGLDVTVNCAGDMMVGTLEDFDPEVFDRLVAVNIRGTFLVSQQAARRTRPGGAIINISTAAERQAIPGYGPYAMTKGAVEGLTLILARELKGRDITVNTVAPGPTETDLFLRGKNEELVQKIAELNPFGRLGQPEEIADVVAFLANGTRWISGQTIFVNGGMN